MIMILHFFALDDENHGSEFSGEFHLVVNLLVHTHAAGVSHRGQSVIVA